jgi:hypothetical protein
VVGWGSRPRWVEEASGPPVLAQDPPLYHPFCHLLKSLWGNEKLFVVWKASLIVPKLIPGCRKCGAVDEDVFGCLASPPTAAEGGQDCGHACLVEEGIEAILSGP